MFTLLLIVTLAAGQGPARDARLFRARVHFYQLDYDQAADLLTEVTSDPSVSEADLFTANMLAGRTNVILGKSVEARLHFIAALRHDPSATLSGDDGPKVTSFFELVKKEVVVAAPRTGLTDVPPDVANPRERDTSAATPKPQIDPETAPAPPTSSALRDRKSVGEPAPLRQAMDIEEESLPPVLYAGLGLMATGIVLFFGAWAMGLGAFYGLVFPQHSADVRSAGRWVVVAAVAIMPLSAIPTVSGAALAGASWVLE